jgi:polysaccharide export outer membrane protein
MYPALNTTRCRFLLLWTSLAAASLLFGGCATPNGAPDDPSPPAVDPELAMEEVQPELDPLLDALGAGGVVRPGLYLSVTVMVAGREKISESSRQVAEEGTLDLPLIGKVMVAGLRRIEVEALLVEQYRTYLVEPHVVVEFAQPSGSGISPWGYVTVLGRIRNPGKIPIPATQDLTVSAAIQQAGGLIASARDSRIRVIRQEEDGTVRRMEVDLRAFARGQLDEEIVLQAGDVVFVPERMW